MIPAIADAIIALINSSPRSPTKAEIEAVLREALKTDTFADMLEDKLRGGFLRQLTSEHAAEQLHREIRDLAAKHMGLRVGDILKGEEPTGLADDGSAVFGTYEPAFRNAIGDGCPMATDGKHAWAGASDGLQICRCGLVRGV